MKVLSRKYQLVSIFFMSLAVIVCTANDEIPGTDVSVVNDQCSSLAELHLPHSVITQAQLITAGDFVLKSSDFWIEYDQRSERDAGKTKKTANRLAFCRIQAIAVPTNDSHIKIEL